MKHGHSIEAVGTIVKQLILYAYMDIKVWPSYKII